MSHVAAKKLAHDQPHDQQRQQRVQNAPGHPQNGAFIFLGKISLHQFFKKEMIFSNFLHCN
jgi:hypothetical protein